jgi:hypothetical protein
MKIEFSAQSFDKYSNIKFYEYPYMGCKLFRADGRTEGQTEKMELKNLSFMEQRIAIQL